MSLPRRRRTPIPHTSPPKSPLHVRVTERLRSLRRRRTAASPRVPTSPRGLEATASRLPSRYRAPRRQIDRRPRRLFVFVSVLVAAVLLLGTVFGVATQTPTT